MTARHRRRTTPVLALTVPILLTGGLVGFLQLGPDEAPAQADQQVALTTTGAAAFRGAPQDRSGRERGDRTRAPLQDLGTVSGTYTLKGPDSVPEGGKVLFSLAGKRHNRWFHLDREAPFEAQVDTTKLKDGPYLVRVVTLADGKRPARTLAKLTIENGSSTPTPTDTATPTPTETAPEPTETAPTPTETAPEPTETAPTPTETAPEPTETAPEPTQTAPEPTQTWPTPTETAPEPTPTAPEPTETEPVPTTTAPEPTQTEPVPTTTAPEPTETAPVPTTTAPAPTTPAPTTPPAEPTTQPTTPSGGTLAEQVVKLTNAERAEAGCGPLAIDATLTQVAQAHSADMAAKDYFSHTGKDGRSPFDRMTDAGYEFRLAAENIAAGYPAAADVVTGWMGSAGHKANILNCGLTEIGVGYATGGQYGSYWTQVFGTPA